MADPKQKSPLDAFASSAPIEPEQAQGRSPLDTFHEGGGVVREPAKVAEAQDPSQDEGALGKFGNPGRWQATLTGTGPYSYNAQHPDAPMVAGSPPVAMTGAAAPKALMAAAGALNASAPRRIGTAGAVGAAEGALHEPAKGDSRLGNAARGFAKGAGIAAGAETLAGLLSATGIGSKWFGRKTGGLDPEEANAYVKNPQEAEAMATMNRQAPNTLAGRMRAKIGGSLKDLFENVSKPELEEVTKAGVGKSVRVNPSDFEGTAATDEISRAQKLKGDEGSFRAPSFEVNRPSYTPVETTQSYGKPSVQRFQPDGAYEPMEIPVSSVDTKITPSGKPVEMDPVLTPHAEVIGTPKPADTLDLTSPQALRAKRAAQNAHDFSPGLNPTVADNEAAKRNAAAAASLGSGLEGTGGPKIAKAMETLSENSRMAEAANKLFASNPTRILQSTDTIGSTPVRAVQDFLDAKTGSNFKEAADAFGAGSKLTQPHQGAIHRSLGQLLARGSLRAAGKFQGGASNLRTPGLPEALMRLINQNSSEK